MKKFEFLDLELKYSQKKPIDKVDIKHKCLFPTKDYEHQFHTDVPQLNTLVDFHINQAEALEFYFKKYHSVMEILVEERKSGNKRLRNLEENHAFVKDQNNEIIKRLKINETEKKEIEVHKSILEKHLALVSGEKSFLVKETLTKLDMLGWKTLSIANQNTELLQSCKELQESIDERFSLYLSKQHILYLHDMQEIALDFTRKQQVLEKQLEEIKSLLLS